MCALSSRKTQLVPAGEPVQQPARAEEVDVRERPEEEEPLDARGEADQVQQELLALGARLEALEVLDRVDPAKAELRLLPDRRDVLDRRERPVRSSGSGT